MRTLVGTPLCAADVILHPVICIVVSPLLLTFMYEQHLFAAVVWTLGWFVLSTAWIARRRPDGCCHCVVVTGAASGIGLSTTKHLVQQHGDLVFALDASSARLAALERWAVDANYATSVKCIHCDVASTASVDAAATIIRQVLASRPNEEGIHCLVNLAGVFCCGPLAELDPELLQRILNINTVGPQRVTRAFFPLLRQSGMSATMSGSHTTTRLRRRTHARIINVASELSLARLSPPLTAPYAMSKWGVEAISMALRLELAVLSSDPIHVITLRPGPMRTELATSQTAVTAAAHAKRDGGSLWTEYLGKLEKRSTTYMARFGAPPERAGATIAAIVHAIVPADCTSVNVSPAMRLLAWIPQAMVEAIMVQMMAR